MLLDKFASMARTRAELEAAGLRPFGAVTEHLISATEAIVEGRPVILAGTNNYLGLSYDPRCIAAAREAAARWGTGTTGSRMANGTFAEHLALEAELAELYGVSQAMVFTTGFAATQGLCATLAGPGDVILLDADSHASIYSMLGDTAPLAEIAAIKRAYGGLLMVDEAHSLGVLGEQGRGAAAAAGVADAVDFFVGTFSKSLGAIGGFCASPHAALEAVRFSTRAALAIMRAEPELQRRLWANAERLHAGLSGLGLAVGPQPGPVVAVALGDRETALTAWQRLLEAGVYVNLVVPPASPTGASLLRCSVSAAHSETQITRVVAAFAECVAPRATPP